MCKRNGRYVRNAVVRDTRRGARVPAPAADNPTLFQALCWGIGLVVLATALFALGFLLPLDK